MAKPPSDALTLLVEEKTTAEALLRKAAGLMGGECVRNGQGWRIASRDSRASIRRARAVRLHLHRVLEMI